MKKNLENTIEKCRKIAEEKGGKVMAELSKPFFRERVVNPRVSQVGDNIWLISKRGDVMMNVNEWQQIDIFVQVGSGWTAERIVPCVED